MGTDYLYSNALPALDATDLVSEVGTDVPALGLMLYDNVASQYNRWRQVNTAGDGVIARGIAAMHPYLFDDINTNYDRWRGDEVKGARVHVHEARAGVGQNGAANTAATLTIPANVNGFIYVTYLRISRVATAALAGTALLTITTTGILGTPSFRCGNVMAAGGTTDLINMTFMPPLRGSAINTAMTFVAPAPGAAVSWDMQAFYHHSP